MTLTTPPSEHRALTPLMWRVELLQPLPALQTSDIDLPFQVAFDVFENANEEAVSAPTATGRPLQSAARATAPTQPILPRPSEPIAIGVPQRRPPFHVSQELHAGAPDELPIHSPEGFLALIEHSRRQAKCGSHPLRRLPTDNPQPKGRLARRARSDSHSPRSPTARRMPLERHPSVRHSPVL